MTNKGLHFRYCDLCRTILAIFALLLIVQPAMAISAGFVPAGVSLTTIETVRSTYDAYFTSGTSTASVMNIMKERNHIDKDDVGGSVSYEKTTAFLHYQYGLLDTVNLGLIVPYVDSARNSEINLYDSTQAGFADSIDSAKASGVGDVELVAMWRLLTTDVADVQLGLGLNGDNGSYNGEDNDKMSLGSGSYELSFYAKVLLYSIDSRLNMSLELEHEFTADASVKNSDGRSVTKTKGNYSSAIVEIGSETGAIGYGGGFHLQAAGPTILDSVSQQNGYLGYAIRGFMTVGNLYLLESGVINHPWEVRITAEKRIAGDNASDLQLLSVKLSTYF